MIRWGRRTKNAQNFFTDFYYCQVVFFLFWMNERAYMNVAREKFDKLFRAYYAIIDLFFKFPFFFLCERYFLSLGSEMSFHCLRILILRFSKWARSPRGFVKYDPRDNECCVCNEMNECVIAHACCWRYTSRLCLFEFFKIYLMDQKWRRKLWKKGAWNFIAIYKFFDFRQHVNESLVEFFIEWLALRNHTVIFYVCKEFFIHKYIFLVPQTNVVFERSHMHSLVHQKFVKEV